MEIIFLNFLGWTLIIVGFFAIFLPVLPGIVLIFLGIYLISLRSIWAKNALERFMLRHESIKMIIEKVENWWFSTIRYIKNFFKKDNDHKI